MKACASHEMSLAFSSTCADSALLLLLLETRPALAACCCPLHRHDHLCWLAFLHSSATAAEDSLYTRAAAG